MICDNGKYFLYRHIRLDKDEPFYIGIGTKSSPKFRDNPYKRAYTIKRRNKFWTSIFDRVEIQVEVLMESNDLEFIKNKEIELIALYGRRDLGKGTLVNLTDGGDGQFGYKHTKEALQKLKDTYTAPTAKICIHFDTGKEFSNLKEGCDFFKLKYKAQSEAVRRQNTTAQFYYKDFPFIRKTRKDVSKHLSELRRGKSRNFKNY